MKKGFKSALGLCMAVLVLTGLVFIAGPRRFASAASTKVDLDLSRLSGTIVYSQVYNMMVEPEKYIGMKIRMSGYYSGYEDTERGVVYHSCVIPDATACCAQGIEFVWSGEHAWPDDYPEEGTDITVTGRLESYEEDGYMYLHLVDSELVWDAAKKAAQ